MAELTTEDLRCRLQQLASDPEWGLLVRYELLPQQPAPSLRKRLLQKAGRLLRVLGLSRARYLSQPWREGLRHASAEGRITLLIWSDVTDKESSRTACAAFQRFLSAHPQYVPVLVTRLADFAFYSRLGWLVEYLPDIPREGPDYTERKRRYLAWRYRHAVPVLLSSGLTEEGERMLPFLNDERSVHA